MLFFGTYAQTVDAKGRVIVPTAFRDSLGKDFMIGLNGTANAIAFYPKEKWEKILEDLRTLPSTDEVAMDYVRFIAGNSFSNYELDSQGRTILPAALRQMLQYWEKISALWAWLTTSRYGTARYTRRAALRFARA